MFQRDRALSAAPFLFFLDFEPNTCLALSFDTMAKEVVSHAECGMRDLSLVRELSEWMTTCTPKYSSDACS